MTKLKQRKKHPGLTPVYAIGFSLLAIFSFAFLIILFLWQSTPLWKHEGLGFFTGKTWFFRNAQFGALSMIYGTLVIAAIALVLAAPVGIGAAIFISEYLSGKARLAAKTTVELLAGIPSVVYGLLGILYLRDWVYEVFARFDPISGDTLLTAGLLLAIMVLPTIMSLADDALRGVPTAQRLAARGLGLNKAETIFAISIPQAKRGLVAAVLLGLGRALGEGIAVFLVIGRQDNQLPENVFSLQPLLEAGQTLTTKLAGSETNIAYGDPIHWAAILGLGLLLLTITLVISLVGNRLARF